jgi:hypothetical protein
MRLLFTDGGNSASHVAFGGLAAWVWWIMPLYVVYQLVDPFEENVLVDLLEFFIAYGLVLYLVEPRRLPEWQTMTPSAMDVKATTRQLLGGEKWPAPLGSRK